MFSNTKKKNIDDEIMNGDFDSKLDELDEFMSSSRTEKPTTSRSNALKYAPPKTVRNEEPSMLDSDELLLEMDRAIGSKQPQPKTPSIKKPIESLILHGEYIFQGHNAGADFFKQTKFCEKLKAELNSTYKVNASITPSTDKLNLEQPIYIIRFESEHQSNIDEVQKSVKLFFQLLATKTIDHQAGFWVKHKECASLVQAYSDRNECLCILCEHHSIGLLISYFDYDKSKEFLTLCTSDAKLEKMMKDKFLSLEISLPTNSDLTLDNRSFLSQDILKLESQIQSQSIFMLLEPRRIHLFGLTDLVKSVEKQLEEIKKKYASNTVQLFLEPKQIEYLLNVHIDDLRVLESRYNDAKIVETLRDGKFSAPSYVHDALQQDIMKLATLCSPVQFQIQDEAFGTIAHSVQPTLINIALQNKCQIEIQSISTNCICQIPKATAQDHLSSKLTATAIKIYQADLAEQRVDLIVVCSTSYYLCEDILEKAGSTVKLEFEEATQKSKSEPFETNAGQLKCRKILFLPWKIDETSNETFYQSIRTFVSKAVKHAIDTHYTSVAFPSIGCGQLKADKNVIANEMLIEAQKQLLAANVLLRIIFVILQKQHDVYDAFRAKLHSLQAGNVEVKYTQIPYSLTNLTITIISSNLQNQKNCKKALDDYIQNSVSTYEKFHEDVLKKWTQPALDAFHRFCFERHVIIDMNVLIGYLKLYGSKDGVTQASVEYCEIQTKQSEKARLAVIARDVIWAYKTHEHNWAKYLPDLNVRIEDAHSSHLETFSYVDGALGEYIINFKSMTETCVNEQKERQVSRDVDCALPSNWDIQSENVAQIPLKVGPDEYRELYILFNETMANKYSEIIHIYRIQNKPWYMQYSSYRSFSQKKETERKLFHGCPHNSAQLIIQTFFNRSFAGVNGTVYGHGAYFSANAAYSHSYAKANTLNGERCMFVATVVVGNTTQGDKSMKTPPSGYDSTTDGNHIFVTYRDDQAYAAYLIVYK